MSAIIYQFPVNGRSSFGARRDDAKRPAFVASPRMVNTVHGGAWYHDEAINDEERERKN